VVYFWSRSPGVSFIETTFHWSSNAGNAALLWTLELLIASLWPLLALEYRTGGTAGAAWHPSPLSWS
jgi:hypothetical protein